MTHSEKHREEHRQDDPLEDHWMIEVLPSPGAGDPRGRAVAGEIAALGLGQCSVRAGELYYLSLSPAGPSPNGPFPNGTARSAALERAIPAVFADPVTQSWRVLPPGAADGHGAAVGHGSDFGGRNFDGNFGGDFRHGGTVGHRATVRRRAGVMDPVEASTVQALSDLGIRGAKVRTASRYYFAAQLDPAVRERIGSEVLSNAAIEEVFWDEAPLPAPFAPGAPYRFARIEVPLAGLGDRELIELSERRTLSLDLAEMKAIQAHFHAAGRAPSDVELETIAQTWSEHCCHKTFKDPIEHAVSDEAGRGEPRVERISSLFAETIRRATEEIAAPWCLSVFEDNAGVVAFDDEYGVTFKVETHNHPSAIEPYGGAGTGIGGVIRDTLGTGLGAKPIINTDIFCFGPPDLPHSAVPPGALHPLRVLRGVVSGVRDYGNRMGIPTASGALYFDERYVGNPLVFCGSVGLIPLRALRKEVREGDRIYLCGGRTGRDGIHGATFSSASLTEESEEVSSGAVQIGNAITEKKLLDVLLEARDRGLFRAVTDCGAGGLSSAVGEMAAAVAPQGAAGGPAAASGLSAMAGAEVHLEKVPLKYEGLSPSEIWISEAQERMVLAVPPERAAELERLAQAEDVECTDIGAFTSSGRLVLLYGGEPVGDLDLGFLHGSAEAASNPAGAPMKAGRPRQVRRSVYVKQPPAPVRRPQLGGAAAGGRPPDLGAALRRILAAPNVASKERIIRQYDHEVQGASVLKPLVGRWADGPGDACAFAPRLGSSPAASRRAVVIGCGMNPLYGDLDPYRMAMAAVDEALRNVVAAGGDPERAALLDNFAWGNTRRPEVLGSLVEAAKGCRDAAIGFGAPFISGKDSLNNEFQAGGQAIQVPPSLLISSLAIAEDARRLCSMDLKGEGNALVLVGETRAEMGGSHYLRLLGGEGGMVPAPRFPAAREILLAIHRLHREGLLLSCHDLSEGGLAVAAAEMAFAGDVGAELWLDALSISDGAGPARPLAASPVASSPLDRAEVCLFSESCTRFLVEARPADLPRVMEELDGLPAAEVGRTVTYKILRVTGHPAAHPGSARAPQANRGEEAPTIFAEALADLRKAWKEGLHLA